MPADGLGRLIQAQGESEEANKLVVVHQAYDAAGRLAEQSLPGQVTATLGVYQSPNWQTLDATSYEYDALGRTTLVTHPDGTSVEQAYDYLAPYGWRTRTWYENDHLRAQFHDPFGRLVRVREWIDGNSYDTTYGRVPVLCRPTTCWTT